MPTRFGGRTAAGRVTGIAVTGTAGIVSPGAANESCCGMTGRAVQAGRDMGRHGIRLAFRSNTIVTGSTIIDDSGMIEACRHEPAGGVTDAAILVGIDMVGFLGCGETGVMAGGAVIHDAGMIEGGRQETRGHVTITTVSVGRHMEVIFAGGGNPIMTGRTVIHDALVFEPGVGKGSRGMAYRTILGGWNVVGVGFRVFAGGVDAIVAGGAVVHDTGMIEYRRGEGAASHVANPAILGSCNVGRIDLRILAGGGNTVMAGITAHGQHRGVVVIDEGVGKSGRVMAKSTIGRSHRVWWSGCLAPGSKGHETTIMAGDTITGNARVRQHRCRFEPGNRMAQITILGSR